MKIMRTKELKIRTSYEINRLADANLLAAYEKLTPEIKQKITPDIKLKNNNESIVMQQLKLQGN